MGISDIIESAKDFIGLANYKYSALSEHESRTERREQRRALLEKYRRTLRLTMVGMVVFAVLFVIAVSSTGNTLNNPTSCDSVDQGFQCSPDISQSWGQYSSFFSVPSEISSDIPQGCTVTFAQVLSRHGARDPTPSRSDAYASLIENIQENATSYGAGFEFIKDFRYTLGKDHLTVFGARQLYNSGIKFYQRYRALAASNVPFFRASGQERVFQSARNFTAGFHESWGADEGSGTGDGTDGFPYPIVVISEEEGMNNTLSHGLCNKFETGAIAEIGDKSKAQWADVFIPPIQARLNENLPGTDLTAEEVISLMDLCPFTAVAGRTGTPTEFCDLFTPEEWKSYDYYQSLDKWYGYGSGNPLGPTQGVGFVNELVARLVDKPVEDETSTNRTLDADPATFPLGRKLYADFSHDNDMAMIFAAMGLFTGTEDLDLASREDRNETSGFSASVTVPFAARLYVEKMVCGGEKREEGEMVRVLLNDRVMPLQGCGSDELGRCKLEEFVESMSFARRGGLWDECFP